MIIMAFLMEKSTKAEIGKRLFFWDTLIMTLILITTITIYNIQRYAIIIE